MAAANMKNKNAAENFINMWNAEFPDYQLTVEKFIQPHSVFGALFRIFDRLRIDVNSVLMPPTEKNLNDDIVHYCDLLPFINVTRVINHIVSVMPQVDKVSVNLLLQPSVATTHSILLILFNFMLFNEQQLTCIAPGEEELFNFANMVTSLEEERNNLLEQMNTQAEEKGKRAERMEQYERELQQLEEEIKMEEESYHNEKRELDKVVKENDMTDMILDQKRATLEGLVTERDRKKALRVYDAEDVKTQVTQAAQNVQEAEEILESLKSKITQKENNLNILQMNKSNLDTANNLLHEIANLKDMGNLDEDSKDGELEMLNTDLMELQAMEAEERTRREEAVSKWHDGESKRQGERMAAANILRDAEKCDKKRRELSAAAAQRTKQIMKQTVKYEEEKARGMDTIQKLKDNYINELKELNKKLEKQLKQHIENTKEKY